MTGAQMHKVTVDGLEVSMAYDPDSEVLTVRAAGAQVSVSTAALLADPEPEVIAVEPIQEEP